MSAADAFIARLEAHALRAWPASIVREAPGGWLLRATPGLDRARSNNALPPCRQLAGAEIGPAVDAVEAFAAEQGIRPGVQVSPGHLHDALDAELERRGYEPGWPTDVLVGAAPAAVDSSPLIVDDHASAQWLDTWARAEGRDDAAAHAATVFALLAGGAHFARFGDHAAGIAVPGDGLCGLFCLAVAPDQRRRGIGERLVRALAAHAGEPQVYLQVEASNIAAHALYARLGFERAYGYRHRAQS